MYISGWSDGVEKAANQRELDTMSSPLPTIRVRYSSLTIQSTSVQHMNNYLL